MKEKNGSDNNNDDVIDTSKGVEENEIPEVNGSSKRPRSPSPQKEEELLEPPKKTMATTPTTTPTTTSCTSNSTTIPEPPTVTKDDATVTATATATSTPPETVKPPPETTSLEVNPVPTSNNATPVPEPIVSAPLAPAQAPAQAPAPPPPPPPIQVPAPTPTKTSSGPRRRSVNHKHMKILTKEERDTLKDITAQEIMKDMAFYMQHVLGNSRENIKNVMNKVMMLVNGYGVRHQTSTKEGSVFRKGVQITLDHDFATMDIEANEWVHAHGGDVSHGWLIKLPLRKMWVYQVARFERKGPFFDPNTPTHILPAQTMSMMRAPLNGYTPRAASATAAAMTTTTSAAAAAAAAYATNPRTSRTKTTTNTTTTGRKSRAGRKSQKSSIEDILKQDYMNQTQRDLLNIQDVKSLSELISSSNNTNDTTSGVHDMLPNDYNSKYYEVSNTAEV